MVSGGKGETFFFFSNTGVRTDILMSIQKKKGLSKFMEITTKYSTAINVARGTDRCGRNPDWFRDVSFVVTGDNGVVLPEQTVRIVHFSYTAGDHICVYAKKAGDDFSPTSARVTREHRIHPDDYELMDLAVARYVHWELGVSEDDCGASSSPADEFVDKILAHSGFVKDNVADMGNIIADALPQTLEQLREAMENVAHVMVTNCGDFGGGTASCSNSVPTADKHTEDESQLHTDPAKDVEPESGSGQCPVFAVFGVDRVNGELVRLTAWSTSVEFTASSFENFSGYSRFRVVAR